MLRVLTVWVLGLLMEFQIMVTANIDQRPDKEYRQGFIGLMLQRGRGGGQEQVTAFPCLLSKEGELVPYMW